MFGFAGGNFRLVRALFGRDAGDAKFKTAIEGD